MQSKLLIVPQMDEQASVEWTTPEERSRAEGFAPLRRREYLAWRAVVRQELGRDVVIEYNEVGAPVLANRDVQISVSHCKGWVAVVFSQQPCAVDIESLDRNFERVAAHYLTEQERMLSDDLRFLAVAWSAKETLYKYSGREGLDLRENLHLSHIDWLSKSLVGSINNEPDLGISFEIDQNRVITYIY